MHQDRGFQKKTRTEIVEDMKSRASNLFGSDVNLAINSFLGIIIQLISWPISLLWKDLEHIYNAMYYKTASGQDLDNRAKNIGITRITAAKAQGEVEFTGDEETLIPKDYIVETSSDPPIQFQTTEEVRIDSSETAIAKIEALEAGSGGNVSSNTITEIVNPISGLDGVANPDPTQGGRDRESDLEFRQRYENSLDRPGGSTINSIRANILEETEATACIVLQNYEDEVNSEGLPGKSYEAICLGGESKEVAKAIFEKAPGGIQPFGEIVEEIIDDSGIAQKIYFSRATQIDIYCNIDINTSGDFPQDGKDQVIDQVIDYIGGINTEGKSVPGLSISQDVIQRKLIGEIINNVEGIDDIPYLGLGLASDQLSEENIDIGFREVARSEPDFIEVEV